jgi:hypothetical protein
VLSWRAMGKWRVAEVERGSPHGLVGRTASRIGRPFIALFESAKSREFELADSRYIWVRRVPLAGRWLILLAQRYTLIHKFALLVVARTWLSELLAAETAGLPLVTLEWHIRMAAV